MTHANARPLAEDEPGAPTKLNLTPPAAVPARGVSREEVRHVAALASLELTLGEEESMERDLNAILGYIAELNELDTAKVQPLSQVSELFSSSEESVEKSPMPHLRSDEPRPSLLRKTIMADAPATDGTFFKVPKVIER